MAELADAPASSTGEETREGSTPSIATICGYDGIGRHAGFRFLCLTASGFKSPYPHHMPAWRNLVYAADLKSAADQD